MSEPKKCNKCTNPNLTLDDFHLHPSTKDKRNPTCKKCMAAYMKKRYLANPDPIKKIAAEWQTKNRERAREIKRNWARKQAGAEE